MGIYFKEYARKYRHVGDDWMNDNRIHSDETKWINI